jgi:hypothetical protein
VRADGAKRVEMFWCNKKIMGLNLANFFKWSAGCRNYLLTSMGAELGHRSRIEIYIRDSGSRNGAISKRKPRRHGQAKDRYVRLRFSNASNVPGRALTKALGNGEEDCELLASEIVPSDLLGQSFSSVGRRQSAKVASQQGAKRADNYAMLILWQRNKQDRL